MIALNDVKKYLPQYLSPGTTDKLLSDLKDFPGNIDTRLYGFEGKEDIILYQGDGVNNLRIFKLPDTESKSGNAIIISNTCDIDISNTRKFKSSMIYAPLIKLNKYESVLRSNIKYSKEEIDSHLEDIRQQRITQIFYLPACNGFDESFALLDRLISINNDSYNRQGLSSHRIFSLSQYGHYLFLYKISIHFTRFHEKVDRIY